MLLLCLGQGTRIIEFTVDASKTYRVEIELGVTTDTYDASGKVIQRQDPSFITRDQVERVLESFQGARKQIPPMYSAIRYKGKRLYQLARLGIEVERKAREVHLFHLELIEWQPPVITIEVECSTGTYIRSLAQDVGVALGCGAYLKKLVRLRCGNFDIAQAIPLPSLEEAFHYGSWLNLLHPIDEALLDWEAVIVSEEDEGAIRNGRSLRVESSETSPDSQRCRAYSLDGCFLAVLRWQEEERLWHPDKVFLSESDLPKVTETPLTIQSEDAYSFTCLERR
jgi:tRNA pseudouridine55 synthase